MIDAIDAAGAQYAVPTAIVGTFLVLFSGSARLAVTIASPTPHRAVRAQGTSVRERSRSISDAIDTRIGRMPNHQIGKGSNAQLTTAAASPTPHGSVGEHGADMTCVTWHDLPSWRNRCAYALKGGADESPVRAPQENRVRQGDEVKYIAPKVGEDRDRRGLGKDARSHSPAPSCAVGAQDTGAAAGHCDRDHAVETWHHDWSHGASTGAAESRGGGPQEVLSSPRSDRPIALKTHVRTRLPEVDLADIAKPGYRLRRQASRFKTSRSKLTEQVAPNAPRCAIAKNYAFMKVVGHDRDDRRLGDDRWKKKKRSRA